MMRRQDIGQKGTLLVNGRGNIFYIRDATGDLWAVRSSWDTVSRYWTVGAHAIAGPGRWCGGYLVISR